MSLTRGMLKGMGLTEEQVSAIIDAHAETVDGLKDSLKAAKADADKLKEVQKELDSLKATDGDDFKTKYEKEHADFEAYKKTVAGEKADAEKRSLYRDLLKGAGVDAKRIDTVMKVTDLSGIKVKDGKIDNADDLTKQIQKDWADFIGTTTTKGASVQTPPSTGKVTRSREDIIAIKDTAERQRAIAENPEAFGIKL